MKKGIVIAIIGLGILVTLGTVELDTTTTESIEEIPIVDEQPVIDEEPAIVEEVVTSEGRSVSINLSDGVGAGDR